MATLLLIVIYISFIGLGIPDSLFGAAWPAVYQEFALPVSYATFVTITTSVCTFISSLVSSRVIARFGTAKVTAYSTLMTAAALFLISFSDSYLPMILLAIPLGFGAGAVDSALNNYVALHYNAMQMNFLHCFYGVGVSISPYLLSAAMSGSGSWQNGYRLMATVQLGIALLAFVTLPLWKKQKHYSGEAQSVKALSIKDTLKLSGMPAVMLMFAFSCAIETCCGTWGSTFLVTQKGLTTEAAARTVTLYYVGIALGRFVSGLLSKKLKPRTLIFCGEALLLLAIIMLALPLPMLFSGMALLMIGLGVAPVYPNLMHLTPSIFGADVSQSAMGVQMASASAGILIAPVLFGWLTEITGAGALPYYMLVIASVLFAASLSSSKHAKARQDRSK